MNIPPKVARRGDLSRVQRQFGDWRSKRSRGTRIPDRLWCAAVEQAGEHGISKTCQALGLDYYALKKRVEAGPPPGSGQDGAERFVEIPLAAAASGPMCMLEVEDTSGARLRLELKGVPACELAGLVRTVWVEER